LDDYITDKDRGPFYFSFVFAGRFETLKRLATKLSPEDAERIATPLIALLENSRGQSDAAHLAIAMKGNLGQVTAIRCWDAALAKILQKGGSIEAIDFLVAPLLLCRWSVLPKVGIL